MDDRRFNQISDQMRSMLTTIVLDQQSGGKILPGEVHTYNAFFNGTEVVVLGYTFKGEDGHNYTKPICIAVDEEVMVKLRVDQEAGRMEDGSLVDPKVV